MTQLHQNNKFWKKIKEKVRVAFWRIEGWNTKKLKLHRGSKVQLGLIRVGHGWQNVCFMLNIALTEVLYPNFTYRRVGQIQVVLDPLHCFMVSRREFCCQGKRKKRGVCQTTVRPPQAPPIRKAGNDPLLPQWSKDQWGLLITLWSHGHGSSTRLGFLSP